MVFAVILRDHGALWALVSPFSGAKNHWQVHEKLLYGQLIKRKARRKLQYAITRMFWGNRFDLSHLLQEHGYSYMIQTAFIERVNLTFRQSVAPLTRRTRSLPQSEQALPDQVEWFRFHYHLARPTNRCESPCLPGRVVIEHAHQQWHWA